MDSHTFVEEIAKIFEEKERGTGKKLIESLRAEGELRAKIKMAKKMLENKMSIEDICKYTDLTKEDLEREGLIE